jgi:hypothetical protein
VCSKGTAAALLTQLSCLIHAVDDGELTLDLGKKKKKKKKDAAAEPAVSTDRARVIPQQPCTFPLFTAWQLLLDNSMHQGPTAIHKQQHAMILSSACIAACSCRIYVLNQYVSSA